ncbi:MULTISPECIES: TetR/AcrR family transcriptional regulator [Mycobacterium]|uniref:Helix-turn-helix domain-containing protein n=1 Tax=Mycobacterium intracellulare subsp. chimaera TaxID=222805 RepID=A0A222S0A1_MYCIT|nr:MULTISPECIES: helix-turn-helix domain-containing protein [Mycobacterium]ARR75721.1 transcriptional regulator, TetR family [Mycobacterium intracellulare subsp. yongonense]ARR80878.1 TetR family transcriptional regulator [Mycobacterium intracellulare subsp. yongonense]ASL12533.1 TetR family transcriptional regulator [Mycobacterium intracellulare subsp. chimaera]ASQ84275.1 TetR family transcriptional regulator [Mycobacterium intracellulare subsp. chimaera]ASW98518.1 TetR/AcrR family transcript
MTDHDRSARASGRPRDTSIDERVLSVTRDLLVEVGWDGLSMRLVAARTGVGRSSLNRRWSSKAELVLHAILGETPDLAPFSGTDLTGWIDWVVRGSHELFARPDVRAAVPGLLLALGENDDLRRDLWARFSGPAVQLFADDVQATTPAKRRRADVDARATLAMAAGAALFVTTVAVEDDSETLRNRIAQLLITAVATSHPQ